MKFIYAIAAGFAAFVLYKIFKNPGTAASEDIGDGEQVPPIAPALPSSGSTAAASGVAASAAVQIARKYGKEKFLNELAPVIASLNNVGPDSVAVAQAILESGFASKGVYLYTNNLFGITENRPGKPFYLAKTGLKFRVYESPEKSILDRNTFLSSKRYEKFAVIKKDYKAAAKELKAAGYAGSSENYDRALIEIIEKYQLFLYD